MGQAIEVGDIDAVHRGAHRLLGAAANLGITAVVARCKELERLEVVGGGHDLLSAVEAELGRGSRALRAAFGLR